MKKTDIKSLIIGFLFATCIFLFMGITFVDQKYGDILKVEIVKSSLPSFETSNLTFPPETLICFIIDLLSTDP